MLNDETEDASVTFENYSSSYSSKKSKSSDATTIKNILKHSLNESFCSTASSNNLSLIKSDNFDNIMEKLSLSKTIIEIFKDQEIDLHSFVELSQADLIEIGISSEEDREKMIKAINSVKKRETFL